MNPNSADARDVASLPAAAMDYNQLVTCDNGLFQLAGQSPGQAFRAVPSNPTAVSGGDLPFSVRPRGSGQ